MPSDLDAKLEQLWEGIPLGLQRKLVREFNIPDYKPIKTLKKSEKPEPLFTTDKAADDIKRNPHYVAGLLFNGLLSSIKQKGRRLIPKREVVRARHIPAKNRPYELAYISENYGLSVASIDGLVVNKTLVRARSQPDRILGGELFMVYAMLFAKKYGKPGDIHQNQWHRYEFEGKMIAPANVAGSAQKGAQNIKVSQQLQDYFQRATERDYYCIMLTEQNDVALFYVPIGNSPRADATQQKFVELFRFFEKTNDKQARYSNFKYPSKLKTGQIIGGIYTTQVDAFKRFLESHGVRIYASNTGEKGRRLTEDGLSFFRDAANEMRSIAANPLKVEALPISSHFYSLLIKM